MKLIRVLTPWWSTTAAWTSASTAAAPAAASTAATHSATSALGTVVNQEGVERQGIGQDVIPNVGASDGECVQILRLLVLDGHFDGLLINISNVELDRGMVLSSNDTVAGGAFSWDVQIHVFSCFVLHDDVEDNVT